MKAIGGQNEEFYFSSSGNCGLPNFVDNATCNVVCT